MEMRLRDKGTFGPLSQLVSVQQAGRGAQVARLPQSTKWGSPEAPRAQHVMGKGMVGRASETGWRWTCPIRYPTRTGVAVVRDEVKSSGASAQRRAPSPAHPLWGGARHQLVGSECDILAAFQKPRVPSLF